MVSSLAKAFSLAGTSALRLGAVPNCGPSVTPLTSGPRNHDRRRLAAPINAMMPASIAAIAAWYGSVRRGAVHAKKERTVRRNTSL